VVCGERDGPSTNEEPIATSSAQVAEFRMGDVLRTFGGPVAEAGDKVNVAHFFADEGPGRLVPHARGPVERLPGEAAGGRGLGGQRHNLPAGGIGFPRDGD